MQLISARFNGCANSKAAKKEEGVAAGVGAKEKEKRWDIRNGPLRPFTFREGYINRTDDQEWKLRSR